MENLIRAAEAFNVNIPDWLGDDTPVGTIAGVTITVREIRRLSQALALVDLRAPRGVISSDDQYIVELLRKHELINAIKYRRTVSNEGLKEAKDYVEDLGLRFGLRRRNDAPYGGIMVWV